MKLKIITLVAALAVLGCADDLDEIEADVAEETGDHVEDPDEEFRDSCSPGFCCEGGTPRAGGTWFTGCTSASSAAGCGGTYLSCDSECYTGESQCHVGTNFNECCIGATG